MRAHARDPSSLISNLIHELSALVTHIWEIHVSRERKNSITCYLRPHPRRSSIGGLATTIFIFLSEFSCPSLAWSFSFPFSISSHMERAPRMLHVPRQPRCAVRGGSFLDLDHGCHARDGLASRVALLRLPDAPCTALASSSWNVFLARLVAGGFGCSVVCLCDEYTRLTQTHRPSTRRAGVDRTPARRRARCGRRR